MTDTDVLVIGAGPYGISVAENLRHRGLDGVTVGRPFELWIDHTLDSMSLRSDCRASEISSPGGRHPLEPFLRENGLPTSGRLGVRDFREYLRTVADDLPLPHVDAKVERLTRMNGGFEAEISDGTTIRGRRVVVATGLSRQEFLPPDLAVLPPDRVLHAWRAREIEALEDERVLVVGAGQSAAEAVADLRERNQVTWLLRHRPLFFKEPLRAPTPIFKALLSLSSVYYRLPSPVIRGLAKATFRTTITPGLKPVYEDERVARRIGTVEELGLGWDGRELVARDGATFDRVVSATGYRCRVGGLSFLASELADDVGPADQAPELSRRFESRVPGLFCVGALAERVAGPAMRFIIGSKYAGRSVSAELAAS